MNCTIKKKLPPQDKMMEAFPLSPSAFEKISQDRQEVKNIICGTDPRYLIIVGPCSAWPKEAVLEYAERLLILNEKVKHALKLVMRVYIQKPRTTKGWTGPVNQPNPFTAPDIEAGMMYTRNMMIKIIEMGLPIADEALFPQNAKGFLELLSWVAIGARSTENQEHRIFASAIDSPVGLKNPTHGSLAVSINSIIAAQHSHVTILDSHEVQTHGNPHAHLVLRGSNNAPNYSVQHLQEVKKLMDENAILNPSVIIDASHDNCIVAGKKDHRHQSHVVLETIQQLQFYPDLKKLVKGFMLESFLQEGNQKIGEITANSIELNGLSITDPCLGWEQTAELLLQLSMTMT